MCPLASRPVSSVSSFCKSTVIEQLVTLIWQVSFWQAVDWRCCFYPDRGSALSPYWATPSYGWWPARCKCGHGSPQSDGKRHELVVDALADLPGGGRHGVFLFICPDGDLCDYFASCDWSSISLSKCAEADWVCSWRGSSR